MNDYAFNRQASFEYEFLDKYEAGLILSGQEVKSVRAGRLSLQGAYVVIKDEEAWLLNANLPPYQPNNLRGEYNPLRSRKLLLHRHEIRSLIGQSKQAGLTLTPIRVYNSKGKIKLVARAWWDITISLPGLLIDRYRIQRRRAVSLGTVAGWLYHRPSPAQTAQWPLRWFYKH